MNEQSTAVGTKCLKCGLAHPQFTHCSRMDFSKMEEVMDEQSTAVGTKCLKCGFVHPQFTHCSRMDFSKMEPNKQVALEAENAELLALLRECDPWEYIGIKGCLFCVACKNEYRLGHKNDCRYAALADKEASMSEQSSKSHCGKCGAKRIATDSGVLVSVQGLHACDRCLPGLITLLEEGFLERQNTIAELEAENAELREELSVARQSFYEAVERRNAAIRSSRRHTKMELQQQIDELKLRIKAKDAIIAHSVAADQKQEMVLIEQDATIAELTKERDDLRLQIVGHCALETGKTEHTDNPGDCLSEVSILLRKTTKERDELRGVIKQTGVDIERILEADDTVWATDDEKCSITLWESLPDRLAAALADKEGCDE